MCVLIYPDYFAVYYQHVSVIVLSRMTCLELSTIRGLFPDIYSKQKLSKGWQFVKVDKSLSACSEVEQ